MRSEHCNRLFQDKKKFKSTNQYIFNFLTQECFQKVRYHQASTIGKEANPSKNVPSFVSRNISIFDLLARFVCSWTTQRGRIQEVVARVACRGVVPCYWYFNTL